MAFVTHLVSRTLSTTVSRNAIKNVTIIGGGLMGSGIAQVAAQTGHNVNMVEVNEDLLKNTEKIITKSLGRIAKKKFAENPEGGEKFISDTMGQIKLMTNAEAGVSDADLVVEAIVENIDIKRKVFSSLDAAAPEKTIFTSNTSSLGIGEIAESTKRLDRFGGLHFFNPVPMMKLVEVVRTENTSDATNSALMEFSKNMGKVAIQAKDTPGFVVNRLLVPYLMEAVKMVERGDATKEDIDKGMKLGTGTPMGPLELVDLGGIDTLSRVSEGDATKEDIDEGMQLGTGVPMGPLRLNDYIGLDTMLMIYNGDASAQDVDTAMKLGSGVPMGPLELSDYVGLDTCKFILDGWHEKYPEVQMFEPSALLTKMVSEGKLGMKSGEGFYSYKKK